MAVLKGEAGETEQAKQLWEEARDHYAAVSVAEGVAASSAQLALLARQRGGVERARQWLTAASSAAEAAGDPHILRRVREVQAVIKS